MATLKEVHENNKICYNFEIKEYDTGLFDSCIDMAYIITLDNSSRRQQFMKQLDEHKPSSTVKIQNNRGYKNCEKIKQDGTKISKSNHDLADALRNIFMDALENNYKRILVFEDDFEMNKDKYTKDDINNICEFINKNDPHVYNLGPVAFLSNANMFENNIPVKYMASSHSVIYNRDYMKFFINTVEDTDSSWNNDIIKKYIYKTPIIYQIISETENQETWLFPYFMKSWLKLWGLDKSYKNYNNHYLFMHTLPWILLLFFVLLAIIVSINVVTR